MIVINNIESLPKEQQLRLQTQAEYWGSQMADLPQPDRIETLTCNTQRYDSPLVSVIIPVYNVEKYLFRSMTSLLNQTCREIEIICVDDCSTDASLRILEFFAMLDARIQIIRHQKNSFAGVARNTGMAQAKGKYLFFADPDDWCEPSLFEETVKSGEQYDSDIVFLRGDNVDLEGKIICTWGIPMNMPEHFSPQDISGDIYSIISPAPWNKLFRRAFIVRNNITFQGIRHSNDYFFSVVALSLAQRMSHIKPKLYHYRVNVPGGLQQSKSLAPCCILNVYRAIKTRFTELHLDEKLLPLLRSHFSSCTVFYELMEKPPRETSFREFYHDLRTNFVPEFGLDALDQFKTEEERNLFKTLQQDENECDFLLDLLHNYYRLVKNERKKQKNLQTERDKFKTERDKFKTERNETRAERDKFKTERDKQKKSLRKLKASRSYQIGRAVTWAPRMARNAYRCFKQHGFSYTLKRIPGKFRAIYRKIFHG